MTKLPHQQATPQEVLEAQQRTAIRDPEHLKRWIEASGRQYMVFVSRDLLDALPYPYGHETLQVLCHFYESKRRTIYTGDDRVQKDPLTGEDVRVPIYKDQDLTVEEMDRCVRWLVGRITDKRPDWTLEGPPL
jgi:hypothetical protein